MVVPVRPVPGLDGDFIFQNDGVVTEINRHKQSDIYCSGIQVINPCAVNRLIGPEDDFNKVWSELIKLKQLYCSEVYPKRWFTVDTVDQLRALNLKL